MDKAGIYIHIPYCKTRCGYCNFVSTTDLSSMDFYIKALCNEIKQSSFTLPVDSIYIGGGTPSMLKNGTLSAIMNHIMDYCNIQNDCEMTIEANPESCNESFVSEAATNKINRFSLGLQSANNMHLKNAGRIASFEDYIKAIDILTKNNIHNVSADIMLGFEGQTTSDVINTIYSITSDIIKHISVYSLKIEPHTAFYEKNINVDEDLCADMYESAYNLLTDKGYNRYEVSNFAKIGYESRHNLKYWKLEPYIGFGVSAHSFYNDKRIANTDNISSYIIGNNVRTVEHLSFDDKAYEYIMLRLRLKSGIDTEEFQNKFGFSLVDKKHDEIDSLLKNGLITFDGKNLAIARNAFYIMNSIILQLI